MGFRIQNNIAAMNAQRNLGISDFGVARSLERLSSGYRINRASDDAAGLSISQAFRADIASYKVAQRNVSEANSLIQVAEGSLDQVGSMLTRMKELATQASSANAGSNLDKIDTEYGQLMREVDRVVNATEYAGTKLLDGTFGASLAGTLSDDSNDTGVIDSNVRWALGPGDMAAQNVTVTAVGSSTPEGTWTLSQLDGTHVSIGNGSVTESALVGDTTRFAGLGITLSNVGALTAAQLSTETVTIERTGLTNLNVSGASAGIYRITDAADDTLTIGNGTITETVTGIQTGVSQTVAFSKLGISFSLGASYNGNQDLNDLEITVAAGGSGAVAAVPDIPPTPPGPATTGPIKSLGPTPDFGLSADHQVRWIFYDNLEGTNNEITFSSATSPMGLWQIAKVDAATVEITSITDGSFHETAAVNGTNDIVFTNLGITITNKTGLDTDALNACKMTLWKTGLNSVDASGADAGSYVFSWPGAGSLKIENTGTGESETAVGVIAGAQTVSFTNLGISLELGADFANDGSDLTWLGFDVTAGTPGSPGIPGTPGTPGTSSGAVFQVGTESNADNQISLGMASANTDDIGAGAAGATAANLGATSLDTATLAQDAMRVIDQAIDDVSSLRGNIGASQNRLSYAAANLSTTIENITAADSVIRDVDMASEMTSFTRNQILVQAGTSMLAQANMAPQQILSLLKS